MNVIMAAPGSAALHMPGPDSDFGNSIKDDLVKSSVFFIIQNPCFIVPEFT